MARTFFHWALVLIAAGGIPPKSPRPCQFEAQTRLDIPMKNNASYPCRIPLVRAGLSRARRARARMRRQRLMMFKSARSN